MTSQIDIVTGAFGTTGRQIGRLLVSRGHTVHTLTNTPRPAGGSAGAMEAFPLDFDRPDALARAMEGAHTLYNTYWVRFNHRCFSHEQAVHNSRILFAAARRAGIRRVVHVSITNPSLESPLTYFRGKAEVEQALRQSGLAHSILRPAVLFGPGNILINNIAWALRRFPVFGLFGAGGYGLQPIHVEDLAQLAVNEGRAEGNRVIQAIGPETFTFRGMVQMIRRSLGLHRLILPLPARVGWLVGRLVGWIKRDVFITWPEVQGLRQGLLQVEAEPAGWTRLSDWVQQHARDLGRQYAHELSRRDPR